MATHLIGDPATVRRGLDGFAERTGADEIMLSTRAHAYEARVQSLRLVAGVTDQRRCRPPPVEAPTGRRPPRQHLGGDEREVVEVVEVEDLEVERDAARLGEGAQLRPPRPGCRTARSRAARRPRGRWPPPAGRSRPRRGRSRRPGRPSRPASPGRGRPPRRPRGPGRTGARCPPPGGTATLNSSAKRAASRGVRLGPPPPTMTGGRGRWTGLGSAGLSASW